MNPIVQKYLEEVSAIKSRLKAKRQADTVIWKEEKSNEKKLLPIGIYYDEDGELKLNLPKEPTLPDLNDCCKNGCTPCVFDVYRDEVLEHQCRIKELLRDFENISLSAPSSKSIPLRSQITSLRIDDDDGDDDDESRRKKIENEKSKNSSIFPLSLKTYRNFAILEKMRINHNTFQIVCKVNSAKISNNDYYNGQADNESLSLKVGVGEHVLIRTNINGKIITKAFTPITHPNTRGTFTLLIKTYQNHEPSIYFNRLRVGDQLSIRGPIKSGFTYSPGSCNYLIMIAAGSGITPMYQILLHEQSMSLGKQTRHIFLIYSNHTSGDIWLKREIDDIFDFDYPDRTRRAWYLITDPGAKVIQGTLDSPDPQVTNILHERLTLSLLKRILPHSILNLNIASAALEELTSYKIFICGPESFNTDIRRYLKDGLLLNDIQTIN
ncbi:hypothetical protein G9A89_023377 [Geosiphon pyriformis]|nr:hypothetical protein G9A89_023377 [Geosiphon pyriformis]